MESPFLIASVSGQSCQYMDCPSETIFPQDFLTLAVSRSIIPPELATSCFLLKEGTFVDMTKPILCNGSIVEINAKILGGKQGALGKSVKNAKPTGRKIITVANCRDLAGRKISALKTQQKYEAWLAKAPERAARRRELYDKQIQRITQGIYNPDVSKFERLQSETASATNDALSEGIAALYLRKKKKHSKEQVVDAEDEFEPVYEEEEEGEEENEDES
ncbi:hypothetical protein BLNAU_2346 [Blattamonas nauphoetae]|uniref:SDE2-like domain-containing protein n=1 Tax=Blattamonas nauphoetae TaxID=2049346 RepID=A0ABQ9YFK9_9EUKA|nr:hypothetical protein BLNAU_2346 [Blattamonas nauphoetae]